MPIELCDANTAYDVDWYIAKLTDAANSITDPLAIA
jgi:hypothetical protein